MVRTRQLVTVALLAAASVFIPGTTAHAACHFFSVSASPANPAEGSSIQVTVSRDDDEAPSHVDVKAIHGSTEAGDFGSVDRTIAFQNGTSQSFNVAITNDAEMEQAESFDLRLSNGGGCAPNPNIVYGDDFTVTIKASDQVIVVPSPTPTKSKPPSIAPSPTKSKTPSAAPTSAAPSESESPSPSESASPTDSPSPSDSASVDTSPLTADDDDGSNLGAIALLTGLLAAALGTGAIVYLRRTSPNRQ